jgi:hypothetical protein
MQVWQRRVAGLVVAAVGATFIVLVIVNRLFTVGPAFERMSDGFRPAMKPAPIAAIQQDLAGMQAVSAEFTTKGVPTFSQALNMTPEEFTAFMQKQFPAVATGIQQLPDITTNFKAVVGTLSAEQARFIRADAIPTSSLPATTVPWGLLAAGILLFGIGLLMLIRPEVFGPALALTLGAMLIVVPLTLSLPGKASAADLMNQHLKPVYTAQLISGAKQSLATVGAMGTQMQTEMLPSLGQQLGMDPAQLQTFLAQNMPAMTAMMQGMPAALGRFTDLVTVFDQHLKDYDAIKSTQFGPIVWTMIWGGVVAMVGGAWALLFGRRRDVHQETAQLEAFSKAA